MLTLILGHSKSGKSRFAEIYTASTATGPLLYIATLIPVGEGETGAGLIQRHRAQRQGMGFQTVEKPMHLASVPVPANASILLEDASNLLGNHLFCPGSPQREQAVEATLSEITNLASRCRQLVVVSINSFPANQATNAETRMYIDQMNQLNAQLFSMAGQVYTLTKGKARRLK